MKLFQKLKKEENKKPQYFALCIEEVYKHLYNKAFILTYIEGSYQEFEYLYLIGPYGFNRKVKIDEIIPLDDGRYGLIVDMALGMYVDTSYILTNQDLKHSDARNEVNNFYLMYLLQQMHKQNYELLDVLFEELSSRCYLLCDKSMKDIKDINNKKYVPLYTSKKESSLEELSTYTFGDFASMIQYHDIIEGIVINPDNKQANILLSKELVSYALEAKNKNMKRYARARAMHAIHEISQKVHKYEETM